MSQVVQGGCHCQAIRFEVDGCDVSNGIACNCSYCGQKGTLLSFVPADKFRLTAGADHDLTEYRFNTKKLQHLFCPTCGVQAYSRGKMPTGEEMVAVNLRCIDGLDVRELNVNWYDGKDA